jgi:hypothetical protein
MSETLTYKRPRLDTDSLPDELLEFARESNIVSDKQVGLFSDVWERYHGAPPNDETKEMFRNLGKRQASAYIDVLVGRTSIGGKSDDDEADAA